MLPEMQELIMKIEPDILWADGDWEAFPEYWRSQDFLAWLYNDSPVKDTVVTNDRYLRQKFVSLLKDLKKFLKSLGGELALK